MPPQKKERIDGLGSRINFVGRNNLFIVRFRLATDPPAIVAPATLQGCALHFQFSRDLHTNAGIHLIVEQVIEANTYGHSNETTHIKG